MRFLDVVVVLFATPVKVFLCLQDYARPHADEGLVFIVVFNMLNMAVMGCKSHKITFKV